MNGNKNKNKRKFTLYFAYGANLNLDGMSYRCPGFKPIAPAVCPNYRLAFKSVADIEVCYGENVYGALYLLNEKHMKSLDRFEGYPNLYIKKQLLIKVLDGLEPENFTLATVYVMRDRDIYAKPSPGYLNTILTGCRQWELPEEYQAEIKLRAEFPYLISKHELFKMKEL